MSAKSLEAVLFSGGCNRGDAVVAEQLLHHASAGLRALPDLTVELTRVVAN